MKKTLIALAIASIAATSANAVTIFENQNGTKVDLTGSARFAWKLESGHENYANGDQDSFKEHHAVANNGSRFGFKITQDLGNDFYALGNVEWRFRGEAESQHNFDGIYARQLYAGIGHKQFGELTYGNMTTVTDEVKQTDLANTLSLSDGLLNSASRRVLQYTYKGIEGLKVGAYVGGHSGKGNTGHALTNDRKNIWGLAAIYKLALAENQDITFGTGLSRERLNQANDSTYSNTAYSFGTAYRFDKTTVGLDLERAEVKDQGVVGNKRVKDEVRTVIKQGLTDAWNVYAMYAHKTNRLDAVSAASDAKQVRNEYMLGTEYTVKPVSFLKVKGFLEWQTNRVRNYAQDVRTTKYTDNVTVVGLRAYW